MEGWRDGGMEGWSDGAIEGWRHQGMERSRDGWMDMLDRGMGDGGMERESDACSEHSTIITLPFVGLEGPQHSCIPLKEEALSYSKLCPLRAATFI